MNVSGAHEFREAARLRGLPALDESPKVDATQDVGAICRAAIRRARDVRIVAPRPS